MKRKYFLLAILLIIIIFIITLGILILIDLNTPRNFTQSKTMSELLKKEESIDNTTNEDTQISKEQAKLYITYKNNSITQTIIPMVYENDFYSLYDNNIEPLRKLSDPLKKEKFDELWNNLNCETITLHVDEFVDVTFQLSRHGYPNNDLDFLFSEWLDIYQNPNHFGIGSSGSRWGTSFYPYKNLETNYKTLNMSEGNLGKHLKGFKINNKWYVYKLNVIEKD